ncbi:hypothetical protein TWF694_006401 [Orbilia ellipsospora]|uniref:CFEM domain-containing protein n=1 Tax=Orbilia ellipsospora TaxID=2528407 RepID=A0AAV9XRQ6_9PEZI
MKWHIVIGASFVASLVSAQIDKFPPCALDCISQLNAIAGCGDTDYACFCNSNAFIQGFDPCAASFCPPSDSEAITNAAIGLCLGVGVTVTVTVQAPTATPTRPAALASFPVCAFDCVTQLNAIAGCADTDFKCFCGSNAFLEGFNPCIYQLCQPSDYQDTSDAAEKLCAQNGVTVTVTATPIETKTSSPGSSSAKSSAPNETTSPGGQSTTAAGTSSPAESSAPPESTAAGETSSPAETTQPAGSTTQPAETTQPAGNTTPAPTSPSAGVSMSSVTTARGNGTVTGGGGSTPTTNAAPQNTGALGVFAAGLLFVAALL